MISGRKQSSTTMVSCHEYQAITAVATIIWPTLMIMKMPVNCRNIDTWSTSDVTRETSTPRRSEFCVSIDRSWTCRNASTRSWVSPRSLATYSRTRMV